MNLRLVIENFMKVKKLTRIVDHTCFDRVLSTEFLFVYGATTIDDKTYFSVLSSTCSFLAISSPPTSSSLLPRFKLKVPLVARSGIQIVLQTAQKPPKTSGERGSSLVGLTGSTLPCHSWSQASRYISSSIILSLVPSRRCMPSSSGSRFVPTLLQIVTYAMLFLNPTSHPRFQDSTRLVPTQETSLSATYRTSGGHQPWSISLSILAL